MNFHLVGSILLVAFRALQSKTPETQITVISDVEYCTGGGQPLLLDVFIPKNRIRTPTPALLWIHGGGWERGDKSGNSGALFLADEGFVTASLFYRLSGDGPFPADIEDCKCAIRFLRANSAKYGLDPDRIGVAGASAGGHLAELVATAPLSAGLEGAGGWGNISSEVQAASTYYGVSDFHSWRRAVSASHWPSNRETFSRHGEGETRAVPESESYFLRVEKRTTAFAGARRGRRFSSV
jgi:acetyl esterase/lipase